MPKNTLILVFLCTIALASFQFSCKKADTSSSSTTTVTPVVRTKTDYLTSKTWIYDEYYTNYYSPTAYLVYKRGRPVNSDDRSLEESKANLDGTTTYKSQNGLVTPGTWRFINNETQTQVTNNVGTFITTNIQIDSANYIWYSPSTGVFAKMIPKQ